MRFLVVWFPDWPIQALAADPQALLAIDRAGDIYVCSHAARRAGVRRGMRVRHAQAICPQLQVVLEDSGRDASAFEAVIAALSEVAAAVEVLRPGLVVVDAAALAQYYGGEPQAVELLMDATAIHGVDSFIGVADEIPTAIIAARVPTIVPPQESKIFLQNQSLAVCTAEEALGVDPEMLQLLYDVGVRTFGDVVAIGARDMAARCGTHGTQLFRIAAAIAQRRIAPRIPQTTFRVNYEPEEPIVRVDTAAFVGHQLASELQLQLKHAGVVCQRLQIRAEFVHGESAERIWRTREALTEAGMADRVRWQLDGWLRGPASIRNSGGICALELSPVEVSSPEHGELWGETTSNESARRAISRVQSTLGPDRVLQPYDAGGRGVATRIQFVVFGESTTTTPPWYGALPGPHPARILTGNVQLIDIAGTPIVVDDEALLSAPPASMRMHGHTTSITSWAGPWPEGTRRARVQIITETQAFLLQWSGTWQLEASYT